MSLPMNARPDSKPSALASIDFKSNFDPRRWKRMYEAASSLMAVQERGEKPTHVATPDTFAPVAGSIADQHPDAAIRRGANTYRRLMTEGPPEPGRRPALPTMEEAYVLYCYLQDTYLWDYSSDALPVVQAYAAGLRPLPCGDSMPFDVSASVDLNAAVSSFTSALQSNNGVEPARAALIHLVSALGAMES